MLDSPLAVADADLLARAADWPDYPSCTDLTQPVLALLAAKQGMDFATALLYERLRRSERHGSLIRQLDGLIAEPPQFSSKLDVLFAVVPGAYYQELPKAGGDGKFLREQVAKYGCRTAVVPTFSMGTVAENGRAILDWLANHQHERIVLASISKGAADIKAALTQPHAQERFRPVAAWINLSGLPLGTPIANWLFERWWARWFYGLVFWWKRMDMEVIRQTAWGPGSVLDFPLELPAHLRLINVVGFPLQHHFSSKPLRQCNRRIARLGPNDGLLLLADACSMPGLVYPVWGADHNLRPACGIARLAAALTHYLGESLNLWADAAPGAARVS